MNIRTLPPDGITQTQSCTWVLREVFIATLQALPFFSTFNVKRSAYSPLQTKDVPLLGVYILDEAMTPDGDANAGEIRFVHTFRLGFQAIIKNNDPEASEQKLDMIYRAIMLGLWENPNITNRLDTAVYPGGTRTPDNVRFEAIVRGSRRHKFGAVGLNNETPVAELAYEATVQYREQYPPTIPDDLKLVSLQTAFPTVDDATSGAVEQVFYPVDFTTSDNIPSTKPPPPSKEET